MTASALPPPQRTGAAARVALLAGGVILLAAVLVAVTGIVRGTFYDSGARGPAAGVAAKAVPDLFGNVSAIDRNVKHLRDATGAERGGYGSNLSALNAAEAQIPALSDSTSRLLVNVRGLSAALADVSASNDRLALAMAALVRLQGRAAGSLDGLSTSTSGLLGLMGTLRAATAGLEARIARIDGLAGRIAHEKLPPAVSTTNRLNGLLPPRIPPKRFEQLR
jgi:hypothetical protein